jgi:hypothetical protein
MSEYSVEVPQLPEFRDHIKMTLSFINSFILMAVVNNFPEFGIGNIVSSAHLKELENRLIKAGNNPLSVSTSDMLCVYSVHDLTNKILVSEYGEIIGAEILKHVNKNSHLKKFTAYREHCITVNNHMIKDIEIKMPDLDGLKELKEKLENITFEIPK